MDDLPVLVGVLAFLAGVFGGRQLSERALQRLSDGDKLKLLASSSGWRRLQLLPLIALVLVWVGASQLLPGAEDLVRRIFWFGLLLYVLVAAWLSWTRQRRLELPRAYLDLWLQGRLLVLTGFVVLLGGFWLSGVR